MLARSNGDGHFGPNFVAANSTCKEAFNNKFKRRPNTNSKCIKINYHNLITITYIKTKSRNYLIFEYYMIVLKDLWQVALFEFLFTYLCKTFYNFAKSPHFRERFGIKPKVDRSPFSLKRGRKKKREWERESVRSTNVGPVLFSDFEKRKISLQFFSQNETSSKIPSCDESLLPSWDKT